MPAEVSLDGFGPSETSLGPQEQRGAGSCLTNLRVLHGPELWWEVGMVTGCVSVTQVPWVTRAEPASQDTEP